MTTNATRTRGRVRAWLREPLFQFTVLGGALFLAWPLIADKVAPPQNRIVISAQQMQRAMDYFYQTHLRQPDPDELQPLIEDEIQTEVEFREGIALGLDRDDEIIRRRIDDPIDDHKAVPGERLLLFLVEFEAVVVGHHGIPWGVHALCR